MFSEPVGAELRARAVMHRPTEPAVLAREARRLRATGLSARDVAAALQLSITFVLEALEERDA